MALIFQRLLEAAALVLLMVWWEGSMAQVALQPPCAGTAQPFYAPLGEQPAVQVWDKSSLGPWTPPACTGWARGADTMLVALAGTFGFSGSTEQLLNRFGAVSALRGIQYWSVTDKAWRALITDSSALVGSSPKERRPDFAAAEMTTGADLFFVQNDSRSTGEIVYRMRVRERGADRLVLELENASPVRAFIVTIFKPGDMKFLYFLEKRAANSWGFYMLLSVNSSYVEGNEGSFINRAAAYYRQLTGVPTDGAPPLAR